MRSRSDASSEGGGGDVLRGPCGGRRGPRGATAPSFQHPVRVFPWAQTPDISWQLPVKIGAPGRPCPETFLVPVMETGSSSNDRKAVHFIVGILDGHLAQHPRCHCDALLPWGPPGRRLARSVVERGARISGLRRMLHAACHAGM